MIADANKETIDNIIRQAIIHLRWFIIGLLLNYFS